MITLKNNNITDDMKEALNRLEKSNKDENILIDTDGHRFFIVKENDYLGWKETAYLMSTKANRKALQKAIDQPIDECDDLNDVLNELDS